MEKYKMIGHCRFNHIAPLIPLFYAFLCLFLGWVRLNKVSTQYG